jgi:hypothetical protein
MNAAVAIRTSNKTVVFNRFFIFENAPQLCSFFPIPIASEQIISEPSRRASHSHEHDQDLFSPEGML